jgi:hypothetical protein
MKVWLAQTGLDGRYLLIWLAFVLPLLIFGAMTPAGLWSGLPLHLLTVYVLAVFVGLPAWACVYRMARRSNADGRLPFLLASWAAALAASIALSILLHVMEGRMTWQGLLQTAVGFGFYGIVVMSIAVPMLFADQGHKGAGDAG